jgi:hypothetical protein
MNKKIICNCCERIPSPAVNVIPVGWKEYISYDKIRISYNEFTTKQYTPIFTCPECIKYLDDKRTNT